MAASSRTHETPIRVGLFVTCLIDLMRPETGFSVPKLLKKAGYDVVVPPAQTCCGQSVHNSDDHPLARDLAEKTLKELRQFDYAVVPSGSCGGMIRKGYVDLFHGDPELVGRYGCLVSYVRELTDFLINVTCIEAPDLEFHDHITYHDSCSGLRELGVKAQPRELLRKLPDVQLAEMSACEACCGSDGTFLIKYGDISTVIVDEKYVNIKASGTDAMVLGDVGCMLNIEGRLRRTGDTHMRVLHTAQVLAGDA